MSSLRFKSATAEWENNLVHVCRVCDGILASISQTCACRCHCQCRHVPNDAILPLPAVILLQSDMHNRDDSVIVKIYLSKVLIRIITKFFGWSSGGGFRRSLRSESHFIRWCCVSAFYAVQWWDFSLVSGLTMTRLSVSKISLSSQKSYSYGSWLDKRNRTVLITRQVKLYLLEIESRSFH